MRFGRLTLALSSLALAGALIACQSSDKMMTKKASLYERLGGKPAITAVVGQFVANIAADDRINQRFAKTDIPKLKHLLVEQVCQATGGPCKYTGRTMAATHKGMNISRDEFSWTGGHLAAALDKFKVPAKEKNELLAAIGSMQNQIVGK